MGAGDSGSQPEVATGKVKSPWCEIQTLDACEDWNIGELRLAWSRGSVKKEVEDLLGSASHNCFSQLLRSEASVYRASHFIST